MSKKTSFFRSSSKDPTIVRKRKFLVNCDSLTNFVLDLNEFKKNGKTFAITIKTFSAILLIYHYLWTIPFASRTYYGFDLNSNDCGFVLNKHKLIIKKQRKFYSLF